MAEGELFSTIEVSHVAEIEEAAFATWPAGEVAELGGWRLRASEGVTNRANSVWSIRHNGATSVDARILAVEEFYATRGLPACFQMTVASQPPNLDSRLADRGYRLHAPTLVQLASLETILQSTPALRTMPHLEVELLEEFEEEWFDLYEAIEQADATRASGRAAIMDRIPAPRAFLRATVDGVPAAVGVGVVHGAYLGISCMATAPAYRRRGAAQGILRAMAIWADMNRARRAFLQVVAGNQIALALYGRLGFQTAYNYYYRILDKRTPAPAQEPRAE
jgi:GNAT superfamily N-acetyltransferase